MYCDTYHIVTEISRCISYHGLMYLYNCTVSKGLSSSNEGNWRTLKSFHNMTRNISINISSRYSPDSCIQSFRRHDGYLLTQMPLPNTVVDFWRLVLDHKCPTIVILEEVESQVNLPTKPQFLRLSGYHGYNY